MDGNEAAARIAFRLSEVIAIYPITPASPMGEFSDEWSTKGVQNVWGDIPKVIEMQSEAGAAAAVHGAVTRGAIATTFTASQGLLLMIPNMFKIAGELSPAVIHVAARTIATHALSIFGDHSDVMAARTTGWSMLASSSVQEAHDLALVAHLSSLRSRVPFLHFFDGFRTSHELDKVDGIDDETIRSLVDDEWVSALRRRGLDPEHPVLRGSAQDPDVFFQAREGCNPFYDAVPEVVQAEMDRVGEATGRHYRLVDFVGAADAERVIVSMGSGHGAIEECVDRLRDQGQKVGLLKIRLFRPFPLKAFVEALPSSVTSIAVLDRTKEPGAPGEPLYQDVVTALHESLASGARGKMPVVIGGRYGLASKEFTPSMVKAVFDELERTDPKNHFTVGIVDDVTHTSLAYDASFDTDAAGLRAVFFGLGSDGTVSANKSTVKIVGEGTDAFVQGYFVYDSKKSGSTTVSHLRFSDAPITSTYLINSAGFVACHDFGLLERMDVLKVCAPGGILLLNSPCEPDEVWDRLPNRVKQQIVELDLEVHSVNAYRIARETGLGARVNTIMQACFFALSEVLPLQVALSRMKDEIEEAYSKRGRVIIDANMAAIDAGIASLGRVEVPLSYAEPATTVPRVSADAPDFVRNVLGKMLAGEGNLLPVSALPVDGTFPTGTSAWEKRGIAQEIPIWDPEICIDCGHCVIVCPHAAIRMKVYKPSVLGATDPTFPHKEFHAKELDGMHLTIQVAPDDCTGCGVCVDVCPAKSKSEVKHKAINMLPAAEHRVRERGNFDTFLALPELDRTLLDPSTVKGSQVRRPLFEFSGACAGCGETPYLKLLTQLFGDRAIIANATGCSSIYGGNLPTTPWATDEDGRGPAWANSLFEDNAEFGLGMRLALDHQGSAARQLLEELSPRLDLELVGSLLGEESTDDAAIARQRDRVVHLKEALAGLADPAAERLLELADVFVPRCLWIVGGDGWAYDIGSAGLDHVLASGRNVNVLVMDTEVYSNTGGQASKATPRGAVAKFASRGKPTGKKDLGLLAASYGNVYVAQIALGANYNQTIKALQEAEAWPGPALVIAYSTCIAHGIEMSTSMTHQKDAVRSGYWPLFRFRPGPDEHRHPFQLDSAAPSLRLDDFMLAEGRFAMLDRSHPEEAARLRAMVRKDMEERWRLYSQMAGVERSVPVDGRDGTDE